VSLPILMRKEGSAKEGGNETDEWETVNQASALWSRPKSELADEDYKAFYRNLGLDGADPLAWTHNRVEGRTEYTQLLFIPAKAPFDIWDREHRHGIKLYVRRVFIMDDAEQLLPAYLRFVRGVIDSADLPLNVSREILQESRDVKAIREGNVRRVLGMLDELASDRPEAYQGFWAEFGQVLKEGIGEDFGNRERLLPLLRFASTHSEGDAQTVSLADYVGRMKEGQEKIYYITAESLAAEASTLAQPVSFVLTSTSGAEGIEDRASQLPLSARRLAEQVDAGEAIVAIELVVAAQAVDLRGSSPLGRGTARAHRRLREVVPVLRAGGTPPVDVEPVIELLRDGPLA